MQFVKCHCMLHFFSPSLFFLDPSFVHVHLIPDSNEKNDDKLYFFFREKSSEMGQSPKSQSRIGRICLVSLISALKYDLMNTTQSLRHSIPFSISGRDSSYSRERVSCGLWILDCGIFVCLPLTCWNPHIFDLPAYNTSLYPCDPWTCDLLTRQVSPSEYDWVSLRTMEKTANLLAPKHLWSLTTSS